MHMYAFLLHVLIIYACIHIVHMNYMCMTQYNKVDWYNCIFAFIAHDKRQVASISSMMTNDDLL